MNLRLILMFALVFSSAQASSLELPEWNPKMVCGPNGFAYYQTGDNYTLAHDNYGERIHCNHRYSGMHTDDYFNKIQKLFNRHKKIDKKRFNDLYVSSIHCHQVKNKRCLMDNLRTMKELVSKDY